MVPRPNGGIVVPLASRWHVIQEVDVASLVADHRWLAVLCDLLERCADDLPALPPPATVAHIREALTTLAQPGGDDRPPYPTLADLYDSADPLANALMQEVGARHATDATHAQDLADALGAVPDMAERISPETLGYMLRCFFNAGRQAMDCEELAILALAGHRLTRAARTVLLDSLRFRAVGGRPVPA